MHRLCSSFLRLVVAVGVTALLSASGEGLGASSAVRPVVGERVAPHVFAGDLRSLPVPPPLGPNDFIPDMEDDEALEEEEGTPPPPPAVTHARRLSALQFSSPERSFAGLTNNACCPPDPNSDVGPNHIVEMVNSRFQIFDKQGNALLLDVNGNPAPRAINQLWQGTGGGLCETTNRGDPVVLYDSLADRWMLSQFAFTSVGKTAVPPYDECIAVSRTGDPVSGGWNLYDFNVHNSKFPDYPHFGVWPDAYYMSTRQTGGMGGGNYAFDRNAMLNGQGAAFVYFDTTERLVPTDLDGPTAPPANAPNPFLRIVSPNTLEVWEFDVDWGNPGASTFGLVQSLVTAPFDLSVGTVPQPGTAEQLEVINDRLLSRIAYRNFGGSEAIVAQNVVDADGTNHAGPRWYELRRSGGAWSIAQQGTVAPDGNHRWNSAIAMDRDGNIAVGYTLSGSVFPSVAYTGRLASDPLGTMPQGEGLLVAGGSSQTNCPVPQGSCRSRWGDYSSMSVDPVDDCTFWYTGHFLGPGQSQNTRIGAFRFCNDPPTAEAGSGYVANEGTGITVDGTASTDPNPTDTLTYDWDLDNNGTFETPGAKPTFIAGDDGVFTIRLRVTDAAGATDVDTATVTVHNVAPTAAIDLSGAILVNGVPTILGLAGQPVAFTGLSTDPGSDDLTLTWDFGDGTPPLVVVSLVNPPNPDPDPSPSIQPRNVQNSQTHTFGDACVYSIKFTSADDDGGSAAATANVVIQGTAGSGGDVRNAAYWKRQYGGQGKVDFDDATLECYLAIANYVSAFFSEQRDATTIANAFDVLTVNNGSPQEKQFDQQLLAALLNFANGALSVADLSAIASAEAVRLDPASTPAQILQERQKLQKLNGA
jgi:PKD domain